MRELKDTILCISTWEEQHVSTKLKQTWKGEQSFVYWLLLLRRIFFPSETNVNKHCKLQAFFYVICREKQYYVKSDAFKLYCHPFPSILPITHCYKKARDNVVKDLLLVMRVGVLLLFSVLYPWGAFPSLLMAESQAGGPFIMRVGLFSWLLNCSHKYFSSSTEISMSTWPVLPSQSYFSLQNKCVMFKIAFLFWMSLKTFYGMRLG